MDIAKSDFKVIDAHAHIYPEKIARAAVEGIQDFYGVKFQKCEGTAEDLLAHGEKIGTEHYFVLGVATAAKQVASINSFISAEVKKHKEFVGFGTVHPSMAENEILSEIERFKGLGITGLKLHPDFQKFNIDDEGMLCAYRFCQEIDMPVMFHTGDDRYDSSSPARMAKIARRFPRLRCIGAHFGGYSRWSELEAYEGLDNVFFDTSSSLFRLPKEKAVRIILHHGVSKFMFGTDYPMWPHEEEIKRFMALDLTSKEQEDILFYNAKNFIGL